MMRLFKRAKDPAAGLRGVLREYELRAFPAAVTEVLRVLRDPDVDGDALAARVEADPSLVVRVLTTVNSAAFGLRQPVDSVGHALAMMGRSRLESLVLGLAVRDALPSADRGAFESARFWATAARRATLARLLAARSHPATQARCFTAALLQDMAVPVLAIARERDYGPVLEAWHCTGDARLDELERKAFGWDHAEIGELMAIQWDLPGSLARAIGGHHDDEGADLAILLVANLREAEEEAGLERLREAAASHGLSRSELDEVVEEAFEQASELASLLT